MLSLTPSPHRTFCLTALLVLSCGLPMVSAATASAAETIIMKYGPIQRSLPVADLRQFADTGKPSRKLRSYLRLAKQPPEGLRSQLVKPLKINVVTLDSHLNSGLGNLLLDEAGRYIHPPGEEGTRTALRSALVLSAASDGEVTLIEALENYPTQDVEVDVERAIGLYRRIDSVKGQAQPATPLLQILNRKIRSLF